MLKITATWKKNMLNMFPFHRKSAWVLGSLPSPGAPRVPAGKGRGSAEIQRHGRTPGCTDTATEPPLAGGSRGRASPCRGAGLLGSPRAGPGLGAGKPSHFRKVWDFLKEMPESLTNFFTNFFGVRKFAETILLVTNLRPEGRAFVTEAESHPPRVPLPGQRVALWLCHGRPRACCQQALRLGHRAARGTSSWPVAVAAQAASTAYLSDAIRSRQVGAAVPHARPSLQRPRLQPGSPRLARGHRRAFHVAGRWWRAAGPGCDSVTQWDTVGHSGTQARPRGSGPQELSRDTLPPLHQGSPPHSPRKAHGVRRVHPENGRRYHCGV